MADAATPAEIAAAFSGHRFAAAYPHLADDVRWVLPGGPTLVGAEAVIAACDATATELAAGVVTTFSRFLVIAGEAGVAVDVIADYTAPDGSVSRVSSCDLYVFADGRLTEITSYTVELVS